MRFVMDFQPRFGYARKPHTLELSEDGAVFRADGMELMLHTVGTPGTALADQGATVERHGDGLRAARTLRAGAQTGGIVLETMGGQPLRLPPEEVQARASRSRRLFGMITSRLAWTALRRARSPRPHRADRTVLHHLDPRRAAGIRRTTAIRTCARTRRGSDA